MQRRRTKSPWHKHSVEFMARVKEKKVKVLRLVGVPTLKFQANDQANLDDQGHWLCFHGIIRIGASEIPEFDSAVTPWRAYVPRPLVDA